MGAKRAGRGLLAGQAPADEADARRRELTAAFLEKVLAQLGITQKELADRAGLQTSYIGFLRKQLRTLGIDGSNKLAAGLELPAWYVAHECGLLPDMPPEADPAAAAAHPLQKSLIREITDENDPDTLLRMQRLWEAAREWPRPDEVPAGRKKGSGEISRVPLAN